MKPLHPELIENTFPILQMMQNHPLTKGLDGSEGTNREKNLRCEITANNDFEAIQIWLNAYKAKVSTHRLYQKESERFLIWCIFHLKKPLSSVNREELESYFIFLRDPKPSHIWCAKRGGKGKKRGEIGWKPFEGGLSESSIATSITVITSLFNYLEMARYLQFNPLRLMRKKIKRQHSHFEGQKIELQKRILETREWEQMKLTLSNWPEKTPHEKEEKMRLQLIVSMLFLLGLRVNELVTHNWNDFKHIQGSWWFVVKGKGDKLCKIPVNNALLKIISHYRKLILLRDDFPQSDENRPIITSWRSGNALTSRYVNILLKKLAVETAKHFQGDAETQKKLSKFSAHWLRHLSATMQERAGISESQIKANMRHENVSTTRLYIHEDDNKRHADMELLSFNL